MSKSRSRKYQEQQSWKAFARYIKMRDAIRTTGTLRDVVCHFCGRRLLRAESQAGHMIPRAYGNALFNPEVVFASCIYCNHTLEGNHVMGFMNLERMVGWKRAHEIALNAATNHGYTMAELEDIEADYTYAAEELEDYYERYAA
jgi:5-methylcytosine-specific restriction endonuclease McrA